MLLRLVSVFMIGMTFFPASCTRSGDTPPPADIAFVREMSFIPEVDEWAACAIDSCTHDALAAAGAWNTVSPWVLQQLSARSVRALSNWSRREMERYSRVPRLTGLQFIPLRISHDGRHLVLRAQVDALPTHDPTVTRHLTLFLLYNRHDQAIVRVTVTIRGELAE